MKICVIGSLNIDYIGKSKYDLIRGESHPGTIKVNPGGVARNIVENLGRMNLDVTFITAIGNDYYGILYKKELEELNVKIMMPLNSSDYPTSTYFAINNKNGNMEYAIVNTDIINLIEINYLSKKIEFLNTFDFIILDTNLNKNTLRFLFENLKVKIIVDTVSLIKSEKIIDYLDKIYLLKTNEAEYNHLRKYLESKKPLHLIKTSGNKSILYYHNDSVKEYNPVKKEKIVSTTGAGDALLSGVIYGLSQKLNLEEAINIGLLFSYYTLDVEETVNKNINSLINRHFSDSV